MRGKKVEPGIYRRESGDYLVRIVSHGTEVTRVVPTKQDALLAKRRLTGERQGIAPPPPAEKKTLRLILTANGERLKELNRLSGLPAIKRLGSRLCDFFGEDKPVPLTDDDLDDFIRWVRRETDSSGDLARRGVCLLRTAHKKAKLRIPTAAEEIMLATGERINPSLEQAKAWMEELTWGSPERALVEIMLGAPGIRLYEAMRLNAGDRMLGGLRTQNKKKWKSSRPVYVVYPMTARLAAVLDTVIPPNAKPDLPILRIDGHRAAFTSFRRRYLAASKRAKIHPPIASLAWLKNFSVTQMVAGGISRTVASKVANHTEEQITKDHYDRADMVDERVEAALVVAERMGLDSLRANQ
jgi:hypothetical protein